MTHLRKTYPQSSAPRQPKIFSAKAFADAWNDPSLTRALRTSRGGVAMIVRSAFLEGVGRYSRLFSAQPPSLVLQFTERVVMHKGRLAPEGSTATAYCWIVWEAGHSGQTSFEWIAPCRKRLERTDDYATGPM